MMISEPSKHHQVQVSILVAARNEEDNIERCLHSLNALKFPKEQIEILIGDDDSDDSTAMVIRNYIRDKPQFKYTKIERSLPGLKGKANVLAQLAHLATGKYFFYCDADIAVNREWINAMLSHFKPDTGVVVGVTRMTSAHLLADLLSMEWIFALGTTRFFSLFKIPITGMGNNMAVTRDAYFKVGGYEKIGFSIVEDYALFMAVVKGSYGFVQAYNTQVLSISEPVNTFAELLKQRKRWIQGVMQSVWVTKWSLVFSSLIVPLMLLVSIWYPINLVRGIGQYYLLITTISLLSITILKQRNLWKVALLFWFYMIGIGLIMLGNYLLGGKTVWKGREY